MGVERALHGGQHLGAGAERVGDEPGAVQPDPVMVTERAATREDGARVAASHAAR